MTNNNTHNKNFHSYNIQTKLSKNKYLDNEFDNYSTQYDSKYIPTEILDEKERRENIFLKRLLKEKTDWLW
jgi:hypothetical protein